MDAPKGRYSVVEKDGRLVVIDNGTGAPIPSSVAPPSGRAGRGAGSAPTPISAADPGPLDRAAALLLAVAAKEWDAEGRAIIAWRWRQNGREKRWDAALDDRQQRRMGRALLALGAAPLFVFFLIFTDGALFAFGAMLALPPLAWAAISLLRLYAETNDPSRQG